MSVGVNPGVPLAVVGLAAGLAVADGRTAVLLAVCGFFAGATGRSLWRTLAPRRGE